jgi:hypothetical protein
VQRPQLVECLTCELGECLLVDRINPAGEGTVESADSEFGGEPPPRAYQGWGAADGGGAGGGQAGAVGEGASLLDPAQHGGDLQLRSGWPGPWSRWPASVRPDAVHTAARPETVQPDAVHTEAVQTEGVQPGAVQRGAIDTEPVQSEASAPI